jgi:hypothetical protein
MATGPAGPAQAVLSVGISRAAAADPGRIWLGQGFGPISFSIFLSINLPVNLCPVFEIP